MNHVSTRIHLFILQYTRVTDVKPRHLDYEEVFGNFKLEEELPKHKELTYYETRHVVKEPLIPSHIPQSVMKDSGEVKSSLVRTAVRFRHLYVLLKRNQCFLANFIPWSVAEPNGDEEPVYEKVERIRTEGQQLRQDVVIDYESVRTPGLDPKLSSFVTNEALNVPGIAHEFVDLVFPDTNLLFAISRVKIPCWRCTRAYANHKFIYDPYAGRTGEVIKLIESCDHCFRRTCACFTSANYPKKDRVYRGPDDEMETPGRPYDRKTNRGTPSDVSPIMHRAVRRRLEEAARLQRFATNMRFPTQYQVIPPGMKSKSHLAYDASQTGKRESREYLHKVLAKKGGYKKSLIKDAVKDQVRSRGYDADTESRSTPTASRRGSKRSMKKRPWYRRNWSTLHSKSSSAKTEAELKDGENLRERYSGVYFRPIRLWFLKYEVTRRSKARNDWAREGAKHGDRHPEYNGCKLLRAIQLFTESAYGPPEVTTYYAPTNSFITWMQTVSWVHRRSRHNRNLSQPAYPVSGVNYSDRLYLVEPGDHPLINLSGSDIFNDGTSAYSNYYPVQVGVRPDMVNADGQFTDPSDSIVIVFNDGKSVFGDNKFEFQYCFPVVRDLLRTPDDGEYTTTDFERYSDDDVKLEIVDDAAGVEQKYYSRTYDWYVSRLHDPHYTPGQNNGVYERLSTFHGRRSICRKQRSLVVRAHDLHSELPRSMNENPSLTSSLARALASDHRKLIPGIRRLLKKRPNSRIPVLHSELHHNELPPSFATYAKNINDKILAADAPFPTLKQIALTSLLSQSIAYTMFSENVSDRPLMRKRRYPGFMLHQRNILYSYCMNSDTDYDKDDDDDDPNSNTSMVIRAANRDYFLSNFRDVSIANIPDFDSSLELYSSPDRMKELVEYHPHHHFYNTDTSSSEDEEKE